MSDIVLMLAILIFFNLQVVRLHLLIHPTVNIGKLTQTTGDLGLMPSQEYIIFGELFKRFLFVLGLIPPVTVLCPRPRSHVDDSDAVLFRVFMLSTRASSAESLHQKVLLGQAEQQLHFLSHYLPSHLHRQLAQILSMCRQHSSSGIVVANGQEIGASLTLMTLANCLVFASRSRYVTANCVFSVVWNCSLLNQYSDPSTRSKVPRFTRFTG